MRPGHAHCCPLAWGQGATTLQGHPRPQGQRLRPAPRPCTLTTNWLLTFSRICFSLRAMASPFLFLILFFSRRLQAYILPVARTWQAQT